MKYNSWVDVFVQPWKINETILTQASLERNLLQKFWSVLPWYFQQSHEQSTNALDFRRWQLFSKTCCRRQISDDSSSQAGFHDWINPDLRSTNHRQPTKKWPLSFERQDEEHLGDQWTNSRSSYSRNVQWPGPYCIWSFASAGDRDEYQSAGNEVQPSWSIRKATLQIREIFDRPHYRQSGIRSWRRGWRHDCMRSWIPTTIWTKKGKKDSGLNKMESPSTRKCSHTSCVIPRSIQGVWWWLFSTTRMPSEKSITTWLEQLSPSTMFHIHLFNSSTTYTEKHQHPSLLATRERRIYQWTGGFCRAIHVRLSCSTLLQYVDAYTEQTWFEQIGNDLGAEGIHVSMLMASVCGRRGYNFQQRQEYPAAPWYFQGLVRVVRHDYSPWQVLHLWNVEDRRPLSAVWTSYFSKSWWIPTVAIGSSFTYLGKIFNFEMKKKEAKEQLLTRLRKLLKITSDLPIRPQLKLNILKRYIYSNLIDDLKKYAFGATWIRQNMDSECCSHVRDWLGLPPSACLKEVLTISKSKCGFGIPSIEETSEKLKIKGRFRLKK